MLPKTVVSVFVIIDAVDAADEDVEGGGNNCVMESVWVAEIESVVVDIDASPLNSGSVFEGKMDVREEIEDSAVLVWLGGLV